MPLADQVPEGNWIARRLDRLERELRELRAARDPLDLSGNGSPEGVVTANVGATWRQLDGGASTTLWIKEAGTSTTGWRPV
jgi:hypothetical protein